MISRGAKSCSRTTACSNGRTPTGRWLRGRMLFIDLHGRLTSIRPGVGKAKGRRYERYSLAARQGHLQQLRQGQHFRPVQSKFHRSEESRVGKECVSTCRSWWATLHYKKNKVRN